MANSRRIGPIVRPDPGHFLELLLAVIQGDEPADSRGGGRLLVHELVVLPAFMIQSRRMPVLVRDGDAAQHARIFDHVERDHEGPVREGVAIDAARRSRERRSTPGGLSQTCSACYRELLILEGPCLIGTRS